VSVKYSLYIIIINKINEMFYSAVAVRSLCSWFVSHCGKYGY